MCSVVCRKLSVQRGRAGRGVHSARTVAAGARGCTGGMALGTAVAGSCANGTAVWNVGG